VAITAPGPTQQTPDLLPTDSQETQQMNPFGPATIDFDEISKRNAETTVNLLKLMFRPDGELPDENVSKDFMTGIMAGLQDNLALIAPR
jgi:hypothetical protein